jgi:hypothetical protein
VEPLPPLFLRISHTRHNPTQPRAATDCPHFVHRLASRTKSRSELQHRRDVVIFEIGVAKHHAWVHFEAIGECCHSTTRDSGAVLPRRLQSRLPVARPSMSVS